MSAFTEVFNAYTPPVQNPQRIAQANKVFEVEKALYNSLFRSMSIEDMTIYQGVIPAKRNESPQALSQRTDELTEKITSNASNITTSYPVDDGMPGVFNIVLLENHTMREEFIHNPKVTIEDSNNGVKIATPILA